MLNSSQAAALETQIDQWRGYLRRRQAIQSVDVAELEDHLREQVSVLIDAALSPDEAFLIAVKRIGELDALSREFAREHSDRLWKQLVAVPLDSGEPRTRARFEAFVAFSLAFAAAFIAKLPSLFGIGLTDETEGFFQRNASFVVLPLLTGYFVWKRGHRTRRHLALIAAFIGAAFFANSHAFPPHSALGGLTALHLPIALWLVVGIAYAGDRWNQVSGRMDFIRFSGELFIYFVLIALGGGVFTASMTMIFKAIGMDPLPIFQSWLLPCGPAAAFLIAAWLVEAKQSVIENMAPVLTRLFTPLFAALFVTFLAIVLWTGRGINIERTALIGFDGLLALVLGLLLYSISARDPKTPAGAFDCVQVVLVMSALLVDVVALWAVAGRIHEFGFTPNRIAALGENLLLLIHLAGSAAYYLMFLRGRSSFARLERWQTRYLPIYAAWAAIVVVVFPWVF